ncbi:MAG: SDR family NAD(P)-dependent oxidoreductase [Bacilli bacterium]|jgi:NAD(P)-dependent dehydrogenase (short-subunit alcohol dehydrogenase family)
MRRKAADDVAANPRLAKKMSTIKYLTFLNEHIDDLSSKVIAITGANSGIGFYAARSLAYKGAHIVMACRSKQRAEEARLAILDANPDAIVDILLLDQASLTSIEQFTISLKEKYSQIDAFVFNAGIFHPAKDAVTKEGFPLTVGTNYLGTYYLMELLRPYFETMPSINVVCVGSLVNRRYQIQNLEQYFASKKMTLYRQYALSKKFMMANHYSFMAKKDSNVHYSMMHPGVASTNIVSGTSNSFPRWFSKVARNFMTAFMNHPEKSALGIVLLAARDNTHGQYVLPRGLFEISGYPTLRKVTKKIANNADSVHEKTRLFFNKIGKL